MKPFFSVFNIVLFSWRSVSSEHISQLVEADAPPNNPASIVAMVINGLRKSHLFENIFRNNWAPWEQIVLNSLCGSGWYVSFGGTNSLWRKIPLIVVAQLLIDTSPVSCVVLGWQDWSRPNDSCLHYTPPLIKSSLAGKFHCLWQLRIAIDVNQTKWGQDRNDC